MSIYDNPWVVHDHLPINQAFPALRSVCADPHIYLAEGFLSADECHGVIEAARGHLAASEVHNINESRRAPRCGFRTAVSGSPCRPAGLCLAD